MTQQVEFLQLRPVPESAGQDPGRMQAEVKDAYWKIFDIEDLQTPPGPELVAIIDARIDAFAAKYRGLYPAAVKCLLTDREGLTAYLRFPAEHHHPWPVNRAHLRRDPPPGQGHRAGSPARQAASPSSGRCWTAPPQAGAV
jgi:hypothetical protein